MNHISSRNNAIIKNVIKLNSNAKERREQKVFAAEGLRLCEEALKSNAQIESAFISETAFQNNNGFAKQLCGRAIHSYMVSDNLFKSISATKTPQGILILIKILDKTETFDRINGNKNYILLEDIQDPNNMGAILRSAAALWVNGVILSKHCCDIYSPKVVRGSMGAVFKLLFQYAENPKDYVVSFNKSGISYAAVVNESAIKINEVSFSGHSLIVIGNEANGLSKELVDSCSKKVIIPMDEKSESLNAAAAASILMWELIRNGQK